MDYLEFSQKPIDEKFQILINEIDSFDLSFLRHKDVIKFVNIILTCNRISEEPEKLLENSLKLYKIQNSDIWKFNYFKIEDSSYHHYEIIEPIEGATIDDANTEEEAFEKVDKLNANLPDYLAHMSTLEGWKDYFTE